MKYAQKSDDKKQNNFRKRVDKYEPKIIYALIKALNELAPRDSWLSLWLITGCLNNEHSNHCLVRQIILQQFLKETEKTGCSNQKTVLESLTNKNYEFSWHNPIVANTFSEAYDSARAQGKVILDGLEKLKKWEKEGKIRAECSDSSPSFQSIEVLDKSVKSQLEEITIVSCCERENKHPQERIDEEGQ